LAALAEMAAILQLVRGLSAATSGDHRSTGRSSGRGDVGGLVGVLVGGDVSETGQGLVATVGCLSGKIMTDQGTVRVDPTQGVYYKVKFPVTEAVEVRVPTTKAPGLRSYFPSFL
jgi:hypothetical protein